MIEFKKVSRFFGGRVAALNNISLQIEAGRKIALLGQSGSGKTTLLRLVNRLIEPDGGTILLNGTDIRNLDVFGLRRGIGYVIQQNGLFPHYTVRDNIAVVPRLLKFPESEVQSITDRLMQQLRLDPSTYGNRYPKELSGGQQQRVGIARALAADPSMLLLDEPFGALDPLTRFSIMDDLLNTDLIKGKTVILVTHDVSEAFLFADRVDLLEAGTLIASGTPAELLFHKPNPGLDQYIHHDRFQLELQTLSIEDIWQFLNTRITDNDDAYTQVNSCERLSKCVQLLSSGENRLMCRHHDEVKFISMSDLLESFSTFKMNLHG